MVIQQKVNLKLNLNADHLGKELAKEDSKFQADLLNNFYGELKERCSVGNANMQIAYIVDDLDEHGKELIESLHYFMKEKKEK